MRRPRHKAEQEVDWIMKSLYIVLRNLDFPIIMTGTNLSTDFKQENNIINSRF